MNKYFTFKIETDEIALVKPTKWSLDSFEKIKEIRDQCNFEFIKYVIYYSQKYYKDNKSFTLKEFDKLDYKIIEKLFISYINSDLNIITKYNKNKKVKNIESALCVIKNYIETVITDLGFLMIGTYFSLNLINMWMKSLKGSITKENFKQLDNCCKLVLKAKKENPDFFVKYENFFSFVNIFLENKKYFYELITKLSLIIEKANKSDIWIPSRYSQKIFETLFTKELKVIEKIDIEGMIFNYAKNDIFKDYLASWINLDFMVGREKILKEAFQTYEHRLYAPAICCLLTQLDYIIVQIAKLLDFDEKFRNVNTKMISNISNYIDKEILGHKNVTDLIPVNENLVNAIYYFQILSLSKYLNRITFLDTSKVPNDILLNRHGILHGKFIQYPNEENTLKIILLIDELINFYKKLQSNF